MKAIVLCGGYPQAELINNLKNRGIETILLDMNENVYARQFADKFYPVSVLDEEAVKQVAIDEKVDMVLTVCADQVLLVAAKVSEELGLPTYIDYKTGLLVSDKSDMKTIFRDNDIPTSPFSVMKTLDKKNIEGLNYPLIVKPVDSYSSRGVKKVLNYSELEVAFEEALSFSRSKTAIVEEFVEGIELTVDTYIEDGVSHLLSISVSDKIAGENGFVINRTNYPAPISDNVRKKVETACQRIADAFNLKNSPLLAQFILNNEDVYVIEFCARTGGGIKYRLIKLVSGFDVVDAVVELTLGNKPTVGELKGVKFLKNEFIYGIPGTMDHLEGFEELLKDGVILEYSQFKQAGAKVTSPKCSGDRIASFTVCDDDYDKLIEKHRIAEQTVKAIDVNGVDIARHDLMKI